MGRCAAFRCHDVDGELMNKLTTKNVPPRLREMSLLELQLLTRAWREERNPEHRGLYSLILAEVVRRDLEAKGVE